MSTVGIKIEKRKKLSWSDPVSLLPSGCFWFLCLDAIDRIR